MKRRKLTAEQRRRRFNDDQRCMVPLLRHFHGLGYTLKECADRRRLDRKPIELLRYARVAELIFPDSVEVAEEAYQSYQKRVK